MKIDSINIQNYGALYGAHTFRFDKRGLVLVLGENLDEPRMKSNGAAKSTIFDALDWSLFGEIPRGDHVDSIINEEAKEGLEVTTKLLDDAGVPVVVQRWRKSKTAYKPHGVRFWVGTEERTALDDGQTQVLIERALGLDREVFHALVLHAQTDTWQFASATDAERVEVLTKVLQLGKIDEWLEVAKVRLTNVEGELRAKETDVEGLRARRAELESVSYRQQIAEWVERQRRESLVIQQRIDELGVAHQQAGGLASCREALRAQLAELEQRAPAQPVYPLSPASPERPAAPVIAARPALPVRGSILEHQAAATQARDALSKVATEIAILTRRRDQCLRDAEEFVAKNQGVCGVCRQRIDPAHVAVEVGRLGEEARQQDLLIEPLWASQQQWTQYEAQVQAAIQQVDAEHARALVDYNAVIAALDQENQRALMQHQALVAEQDRQHAAALSAYQAEVGRITALHREQTAQHVAAVMKCRGDLSEADRHAQIAERLVRDIANEHARLAALAQEDNPWIRKQVELDHRTADLDQALDYGEREAADYRETRRYWEFWIKGLGPKGLKNFILDARVQELTDATNHWMRLIFGGTSWVRFETQVQGRSTGKLANKLNVRCFRFMPDGSVRERNFKSLSGGEKARTSFAIDMGLSRIIASRATKSYDVLILDEVFRHLDSAGREAVVDLLQQLQVEKSSIFVVDHDSEFQGAFEHRVVVRKQNGRSIILEGVRRDEEIPASNSTATSQEAGKAEEQAAQPEGDAVVQKTVPRRRPVQRTPVITRRDR